VFELVVIALDWPVLNSLAVAPIKGHPTLWLAVIDVMSKRAPVLSGLLLLVGTP